MIEADTLASRPTTPRAPVYRIIPVSDSLVYIRWNANPSRMQGGEFVKTLTKFLNNAQHPVYFVSDLRGGCITHAETLRKLGALTLHPNWKGSTAFGDNMGASVFVRLFERLSKRPKSEREIWNTPAEAIAYLEHLQPGVTANIDWEYLIN